MTNNVAMFEAPEEAEAEEAETTRLLSEAISSWYVRRDSKFYDVKNLSVKLSRSDVERAAIRRFAEVYDHRDITSKIVKEVFRKAIDARHSDPKLSIPVWNGRIEPAPGSGERFILQDGTAAVNCWEKPRYRALTDVPADFGLADEFFDFFFEREEEKAMFLDWLAWSLQNEGDKPAWAPFFYSEQKGSGKSTVCRLVAKLFGEDNALTQNSVDKLTAQFNAPVLESKLVITEEVNLQQGTKQANALKTYITETESVAERKGKDPRRVKQFCCFLFTTNHLPLWIEPEDRRYYLIEVDHDGYASGPRSKEFSELVGRLNEYMEDDRNIAALYRALMERKLSEGFSAKTLNVVDQATPLMRRVHKASETTTNTLLREHLDERGLNALPEAEVSKIVKTELGGNINRIKHLMSDLGWEKDKVKWGGAAYGRSIWVRPGYFAEQGKVKGPDGYEEPLAEHFERDELVLLPNVPQEAVEFYEDEERIY